MKSLLALLPLLCLSACQAAGPMIPGDSTDFAVSCAANRSSVRFGVYDNSAQRFTVAYGSQPDKSRPVSGAKIQLGEISGTTDARGQLTLQRPGQNRFNLRISAAGYQSRVEELSTASLCSSSFVALSPLSAEEQAGNEQALQKVDLSGDLEALHQDVRTGFAYGIVRTAAQLKALEPRLKKLWSENLDQSLAPLYAGLASGQALAFLSNGSQGLGDAHDLVQRVTSQDRRVILASHLDIFLQDPAPPQPVGDRFSILIEAVLVPGDTDTLIFDAISRTNGSPAKQRLEVKADAALLPRS